MEVCMCKNLVYNVENRIQCAQNKKNEKNKFESDGLSS